LAPGDCMLFATDGLIEAKNQEGSLLGLNRLTEIIRTGDSSLDAVYGRITTGVSEFVQGRRQSDDITMILLERGES
jgi:phosphoserine phosphatase RsbU/P